MKKTAVLILVLLLQTISFSTIRYVSKTGSSTEPYTSWATAADSIQKCLDISVFGDTIYVGDGVYKEFLEVHDGLSLIGSGIENCSIDGRDLGITANSQYLIVARDSVLISGFKIIANNYTPPHAGGPYLGMAIYVDVGDTVIGRYTTTIHNNFITQAGYAVRTYRTFVNIVENLVTECKNGLYFNAHWIESKSTVHANALSSYNNAITNDLGVSSLVNNNIIHLKGDNAVANWAWWKLDFRNNLVITENESADALNLTDKPTTIINNTFVGYFQAAAMFNNYNNIIKNNLMVNGRRGFYNVFVNSEVKYNCLWDFETYSQDPLDSTNIIAYPMFVDENNDDYHLQMYSPCIDAGDPDILDVDGSRSDIGYYGGPGGESYTYQDPAPRPPVNMSAEVDSNKVKLTWNRNHETDFKEYKIYKDTSPGFTISPQKLVGKTSDTTITDVINSKKNVYYKGTSIDAQGNESSPGEEVIIVIVGVNQPKVEEKDFALYQNYPNPFNPSTMLSYRLKSSGYVRLVVYDVKGELITELVNEYQSAGYYEKLFDAKAMNLSSGVYLFRIEVKNENNIPVFTEMRKSILVK